LQNYDINVNLQPVTGNGESRWIAEKLHRRL
jgi:hypothetical protein